MEFRLLKTFDDVLVGVTSRQDIPDRTLLKKIEKKCLQHGLGHPSHRATKPLINSLLCGTR